MRMSEWDLEMKRIDDEFGDDPELWHALADDVLLAILMAHGHDDVVKWFKGHGKWYS
jgi:hypothetical protein